MARGVYLDWSDALLLPLPLRLAWGGTVADRILELFSPRLREHYHLREGIDLVWQSAATGSDEDKARCRRLNTRLSRQLKKAEKEGYGDEFFNMVMELLGEVSHAGGAGCTNAVDYASMCYLCYQGFRQGIDPADPSFPDDSYEADQVLYQFARTVYDFALANNPAIDRAAFAHLRLDTSVVPLPRSVLRKAKVTPAGAGKSVLSSDVLVREGKLSPAAPGAVETPRYSINA